MLPELQAVLVYRPMLSKLSLRMLIPTMFRRTYNPATYLDERKVMMQEWADMLDKWVAGFE